MSNEKVEISVTYEVNNQQKELKFPDMKKSWLDKSERKNLMAFVKNEILLHEGCDVDTSNSCNLPLKSINIGSVFVGEENNLIPYREPCFYVQYMVRGKEDLGIQFMAYPVEENEHILKGKEAENIKSLLHSFNKKMSKDSGLKSFDELGIYNVYMHVPRGAVFEVRT